MHSFFSSFLSTSITTQSCTARIGSANWLRRHPGPTTFCEPGAATTTSQRSLSPTRQVHVELVAAVHRRRTLLLRPRDRLARDQHARQLPRLHVRRPHRLAARNRAAAEDVADQLQRLHLHSLQRQLVRIHPVEHALVVRPQCLRLLRVQLRSAVSRSPTVRYVLKASRESDHRSDGAVVLIVYITVLPSQSSSFPTTAPGPRRATTFFSPASVHIFRLSYSP